MTTSTSASAVMAVQRQLDAYNARDLERFMAEYDDAVRVFLLPDTTPVLEGKPAMSEYYAAKRFTIVGLHAVVVARMAVGNIVIDREKIFGVGENPVEAIAMYEVVEGRIRTAWFLDPGSQS